jgi:hypothetical protein
VAILTRSHLINAGVWLNTLAALGRSTLGDYRGPIGVTLHVGAALCRSAKHPLPKFMISTTIQLSTAWPSFPAAAFGVML